MGESKMKWEYLLVYFDGKIWVAFDGASKCDGDQILIDLLNRLGQDRWEHCLYASDESYHLLKRSLP